MELNSSKHFVYFLNQNFRIFRKCILWLLALLSVVPMRSEVFTWRTTAPDGMIKAELNCDRDFQATKGILVLCPGMNGNGAVLIQDASWRAFAKKHSLGLVGMSFSSPPELLYGNPAKGYYYPEQGSGEVLIRGLRELYGRDMKIVFYGFSGGAKFGSRFVDQHPDRILSWAAYSAAFWADPVSASPASPPGIVACGEFDSTRYGPSFAYFQQGRKKEARWAWVSVGNVGHLRHKRLEDLMRAYFAAVLAGDFSQVAWLDAETKEPTTEDDRLLNPALSVWLPTPAIKDAWLKLHHP